MSKNKQNVAEYFLELGYWKCEKCSNENWEIYHKPDSKCPKDEENESEATK